MKNNAITIEDFKDFEISNEIAACYGKGSAKSLKMYAMVNGEITFKVTEKQNVKYCGKSIKIAIDIYNTLV